MKLSEDGKMQRNRKSSRCGCRAYMRIVKCADFNVPEWRVTAFSNIHNHELLKANEVCLLPAYCTITPDDKARICMFAKAGMSVRQMLRLMELEKGVKLGCLPFTEIDVRNLLQSFRNVNRDNDPIDLIAMCKKLKDENPNFQYDFKLDGHNRLEHIAWTYASSVQLYVSFGDAVIFDTTHRLDAYDMLLGVWAGVENHGMTTFFGCVLLRDENIQSFSWGLKTFLGFMKGKAPQTLLTDQNMWLKEAIAIEMPETKHAFSICHIISKFSDWFSVLLGSRYDDWKSDFYRLYGLELLEEFEEEWREMIDKYGLHGNKHIIRLYALRTFWALPFLRPYLFAGLTSLCQSETTTTFIQRILSAQSLLDRFVEQVAEVVEFNDRGSKQKQRRKSQKVCLKTGSPIESHAATVLTPYAFGKLQEELLLAPQYASFVVDEGCFEVKHHTQMDGGCEVICVLCEEQISCSCHHFEFSDPYLPSRWRLNSSSSINPLSNATRQHSEKIQLLESLTSALIAESIETKERLDVACEQTAMVLSRIKDLPRTTQSANDIVYNCPSDLILPEVEDADGIVQSFTMGTSHEPLTSGKLKDRRPRDGIDITRKRRHYSDSCCGHFEHDSSDCPMMEGDNLNGDALGYI
ncbi:protein FAR1-RELATED SEQUENCE 11 isoform X2 [Gossypium hirsutum]|uniref:Protein FAR1-RELATED SEQUENCE n=1 Tax=Gossypium hirsutum TaxID=3635 RepID=A0ABM2YYU0_GOSHI|nr:protein FAR1-RELATED SEQUENCE 11-like isoform X2 [Gossypium hirsutum]XP_040935040.1 protein FAR1-RELATED SEQUENCE 11-like isoform X2 [Gossypium hirsutum]